MENCIFCKIINGEVPGFTVYEDDDFKAILDLSPATKGHTLVIPKEHSITLLDLSKDRAEKLLEVTKKIVNGLKSVLNFSNYNIIQNNGKLAGQTVEHFHLHIIPRYSVEEITLWVAHENDPSVNSSLADEIRNAIK